MLYNQSIISLLQALILLVPMLLSVAYITVAERKTMASMQRRLGPNIVGFYGSLQAFADALKLLLKEYISPTQANKVLFFLGPIVTLIFSLLGFSVIPFGPGITISDFNLGILYMLAMSSLSTYGILLAGWSANSKYAFLGSLRSTAQLISYELILSSAILLVILFSGSLSLTVNIESQKAVWYVLPLLPVFVIFYIGSVAETNRAPFDLVEAESELVSGFMTEHAAVVFVFFFLAEYASILLMCLLSTMLFIGGYLYNSSLMELFINGLVRVSMSALPSIANISLYMSFDYALRDLIFTDISYYSDKAYTWLYTPLNESLTQFIILIDIQINNFILRKLTFSSDIYLWNNSIIEGLTFGLTLGFKTCVMIFIFIWTRASYPRIRYDQLMSFCWTILLPIIIIFIILFPSVLYVYTIIPTNVSLY